MEFILVNNQNEGSIAKSKVPYKRRFVSNEKLGLILGKGILSFYFDAIKVALRKPSWVKTALKLYLRQRRAWKIRTEWRRRGTHVPPFMILSVTKNCNLRCKGCYSHALHSSNSPSLTDKRMTELLVEAEHLGISLVLLAGGEPLVNKNLLDITRYFPGITFPLFTNGTLIDETVIIALKKQPHVIPVLSIEGNPAQTDERRGRGIFGRIETTMSLLRKNGIFFGCSITVTRDNFSMVHDGAWTKKLFRNGCRLFFHVEYVPVDKASEGLAPTDLQRRSAPEKLSILKKKVPALFVAFPGDEELFGGCLAAGRGFIHISASGDVEPCPFAPYADRNITNFSLQNALGSPLLEKIRVNHSDLQETSGGCALWAKREWVASLAHQTGV